MENKRECMDIDAKVFPKLDENLIKYFENFNEYMMMYNCAIKEIRTKFEVLNDDLSVMADTISVMVNAGNIDEDIIKQTEGVLQGAYALIKYNEQFVAFDEADKEIYTAENLVTRTKRLLSVFDVWVDFIKGRYAGSGFIFWVIISVLVDLGAFIFFDIAFAKKEY